MEEIKNLIKKISNNVGLIIIIFSALAFKFPNYFTWANQYTAFLLGIAMFGMGLTIDLRDFKVLLVHPKEVLIGCIAQFTIMPLLAFLLSSLFKLPEDLALGLILVGSCPGGTASNVITYIAGGNVALSVGMTIVSTLLAPILTPVLVYYLAGQWVNVELLPMIISTIKIVLLPVLLGFIVNKFAHKSVEKTKDFLPLLSIFAIVLLISAIIGSNREKILTSGSLIILIVILHNLFGLILGLLISKAFHLDFKEQIAISIEVAMQNSGLAISLAMANFPMNPIATIPGAIFSVWHNISGSIYANIMRRKISSDRLAIDRI